MVEAERRAPTMQKLSLSFTDRLRERDVQLRRTAIDTVQINVGKLCNQACLHCHVEAGLGRNLQNRCSAALLSAVEDTTLDMTGCGKIYLR